MTANMKELQGKRVMVTGASGFIGAHLVEALLDAGAQVVANVEPGAGLDRIEHLLDSLTLTRCILSDNGKIEAHHPEWKGVQLLAHLGIGIPRSKRFGEQATEDINMNLLPTINLVRSLGDSLEGICFASSVSVYGNPSSLPVRESDLPVPNTSYGSVKLAAENYLRCYGNAIGVPVTSLRYSVVYGPGETAHRAIPNFINQVSRDLPPLINGDGSEIRDYVYVDDVVRATLSALVNRPCRVINVGSGHGHTTIHVAREIIRLFGSDIEPEYLPSDRPNVNIVCDITEAMKSLSFVPRSSLTEGLSREIEWCRTRYDLCHKL